MFPAFIFSEISSSFSFYLSYYHILTTILFCLRYILFYFPLSFMHISLFFSYLLWSSCYWNTIHIYWHSYFYLSIFIFISSLTSFTLAVVAQHNVGPNIEPCLTTSVIPMLSVLPIALSTAMPVIFLFRNAFLYHFCYILLFPSLSNFQPEFVKGFFCICKQYVSIFMVLSLFFCYCIHND